MKSNPLTVPALTATKEKGTNGKTRLIQRYGNLTITRGKTSEGMRLFIFTHARSFHPPYQLPYDIARLAAGKDAWMRGLLGKCDCGANYPMHESDVPFCAKCQSEAEEENARLDGR